ncbi:MAG: DUF1844 domain-containing protein [Acidobacteriota bacterium]
MADEKEKTFKISDRRRYNPDGSLREEFAEEAPTPSPADSQAVPAESVEQTAPADNIVAFPGGVNKSTGNEDEIEPEPAPSQVKAAAASASASPPTAQQSQQAAQAAAVENAYNQASGGADPSQSKAMFLSLLNMLAVEAAMNMGLMEMQPGVRSQVDLEAAKQVIDMLGVLKEKTRGNLLKDEETIFEQVLADLRMQFVSLSRSK